VPCDKLEPAVKIMLHWQVNAPVPIYPEGLAFFPPFLEGHGALVCDQDPALTVRIRDLNRRFGGLHVSPRLRFGPALHVADAVTEAPAARDVDDAAPLVFFLESIFTD